jgi:hypothetical protein
MDNEPGFLVLNEHGNYVEWLSYSETDGAYATWAQLYKAMWRAFGYGDLWYWGA